MIARLRWLCRRGIKELDLLMENYLTNSYLTASPEQKVAFERLLEYDDATIMDLLLGEKIDPDRQIEALMDELRNQPLYIKWGG